MGAFKVFINGDKSRQGEASLEEAVLEPPGLWILMGLSSLGIIKDNPVAEDDLTIFVLLNAAGEILGLAPSKKKQI